MERKPDIQYVGQFYVQGSTAPQIGEKQKKKATLPKLRREKLQKVYVDPVALCGMTVAVVMLVVLILGAFRLQKSWEQYNQMSGYLSQLRRENAQLEHNYRTSFDLEKVRSSAEGLGMIPREEAQNATVWVSVPIPEPEPTLWDDIMWFLRGLFAK